LIYQFNQELRLHDIWTDGRTEKTDGQKRQTEKTDRQTDIQTDIVIPKYTPLNIVCRGKTTGYILTNLNTFSLMQVVI